MYRSTSIFYFNSMHNIIGLKDLRENMEDYAQKVQKGTSFVVMKRSKPLFRISPVEVEDKWEAVVDFDAIQRGGVPIDEVLKYL